MEPWHVYAEGNGCHHQ
ncbi:hypothetical protein ID866_10333 [Astraeus odoratus]|nr:hypothetical protein ID866_10333 [Astraeus odoratus]